MSMNVKKTSVIRMPTVPIQWVPLSVIVRKVLMAMASVAKVGYARITWCHAYSYR